MTITLGPDQEKAIAKAIESGAYENAADVIERALSMLRAEDDWLAANRGEIQRKIGRGIAQLERGEGIPGEELAERLAVRKTAWLNKQAQ